MTDLKKIFSEYFKLLQALKEERKAYEASQDELRENMQAKSEAYQRISEMRKHIKTAMALLPDRPVIALETLNKALADDLPERV